jgi:hypothetical protein
MTNAAVPPADNPVTCCLCGHPAVAIYYLPGGCAAKPLSSLQALCAQHESRSQPIRGRELLKDLRVTPADPPPEMTLKEACAVLRRFEFDGESDWVPYQTSEPGYTGGATSTNPRVPKLGGKYAIQVAKQILLKNGFERWRPPNPNPLAADSGCRCRELSDWLKTVTEKQDILTFNIDKTHNQLVCRVAALEAKLAAISEALTDSED